MPSLRVVYFHWPGRIEPARLALGCSGVEHKNEVISVEEWGAMKETVAPSQLPLLYVDGECVTQSMAMLRYVGKVCCVGGQPLYPADPLLALKVDEFMDMVGEVFAPIIATFVLEKEEAAAARGRLFAEGGEVAKWIQLTDNILGKSASGYAVGDTLTLADLVAFTWLQQFKTGWLEGIPNECLDSYKHLAAHAEKIANVPEVRAYYKDATGIQAVYKR
eukprot:TRINITY_DN1769_c0_g1_i2.p2 TRINITY_DN1769_c0_g1~~TRINITY_DN1769_c0_g1_i2.p2  ORF type:complete len:219 (+),score=104.88 TRINITY_DN1769_c0_g1_i2:55-711(+)